MVVSHTTTRFEAPSPVTYASTAFVFSLAFIRNIRSGGIFIPARWTTCSSAVTNCGSLCCSGSNLLNIGSITSGERKITENKMGSAASQKYSHHLRGLRRITAYKIHTRIIPRMKLRISPFTQSPAHELHPCTEIPYRFESQWP